MAVDWAYAIRLCGGDCHPATGGYHSLAHRADGSAVAWGNNAYGQTDTPTSLTHAAAIAAGPGISMAPVGDNSLNPPGGHVFITVHPFDQAAFSGKEVVM